MNDRLTRIRESERKSHTAAYTNENLYDKNSWLQKPIRTVLDILPLFQAYSELRVLDLGCGVGETINGILKPIEEYEIRRDSYDFILAVSALEHIDSEESFIRKLKEIKNGVRENGIVCLVINTNVCEMNAETKEPLEAQFEVNLPTEKLQSLLADIFSGWHILKTGVTAQEYDIPRDEIISYLDTHVVTYVAQRRISND